MRYYECQCSSCAAAFSHSHSPQIRLCVFQFPPIPSSPFSLTLCSSESISVTSGHIWTILRLWETWAHLISHLDSSTIRSQALCLSCSRSPDTQTETHIWKHTHTLGSPVSTLSDAQSMNWRPSFHGSLPRRPHCMCMCLSEIERGKERERGVHTLSLMCTVYY